MARTKHLNGKPPPKSAIAKRNSVAEAALFLCGRDGDSEQKEFACNVWGCFKSYGSAVGLYQHRRKHHPELINSRRDYDDDERRFICPEYGCDKCYGTSAGLYQHKRAKHPWLINVRERGYTRPAMQKPSLT